jgi:hypothetical protein
MMKGRTPDDAGRRNATKSKTARELVLLALGIGSILVSGPMTRYLEENGYLDWGAQIDARLIACMLVGMLGAFGLILSIAICRQAKRRPAYVTLLSGYRGAGKTHVYRARTFKPLDGLSPDEIRKNRCEERVRPLRLRVLARYVLVPCLFVANPGILIGVISYALWLWPRLDPHGWAFFVRTFPMVAVGWILAMYALATLITWRLIRRKGAPKAIRFLFPEALIDTATWRDRFGYRVMGLGQVIEKMKRCEKYS